MARVFGAVVVCGMLAVPGLARAQATPAPASAQTPSTASQSSPVVNAFYIGANTGAAIVEKSGGTFGLEGGVRVWKSLDVVGELSWMTNIVGRRQLDLISSVGTFVKSNGTAATGDMKVPAFYGGAGVRWVFEQVGMFKPYGIVTFGGAKYELKPTLTLNGTNVTDTTAQYGVTLGQDVIGEYTAGVVSGGMGVLVKYRDNWYIDGGVRITSLDEKDQRANVVRVLIGGGYRF